MYPLDRYVVLHSARVSVSVSVCVGARRRQCPHALASLALPALITFSPLFFFLVPFQGCCARLAASCTGTQASRRGCLRVEP